jgi:hypothetical protein
MEANCEVVKLANCELEKAANCVLLKAPSCNVLRLAMTSVLSAVIWAVDKAPMCALDNMTVEDVFVEAPVKEDICLEVIPLKASVPSAATWAVLMLAI